MNNPYLISAQNIMKYIYKFNFIDIPFIIYSP
jgi:hypothetical protein